MAVLAKGLPLFMFSDKKCFLGQRGLVWPWHHRQPQRRRRRRRQSCSNDDDVSRKSRRQPRLSRSGRLARFRPVDVQQLLRPVAKAQVEEPDYAEPVSDAKSWRLWRSQCSRSNYCST